MKVPTKTLLLLGCLASPHLNFLRPRLTILTTLDTVPSTLRIAHFLREAKLMTEATVIAYGGSSIDEARRIRISTAAQGLYRILSQDLGSVEDFRVHFNTLPEPFCQVEISSSILLQIEIRRLLSLPPFDFQTSEARAEVMIPLSFANVRLPFLCVCTETQRKLLFQGSEKAKMRWLQRTLSNSSETSHPEI